MIGEPDDRGRLVALLPDGCAVTGGELPLSREPHGLDCIVLRPRRLDEDSAAAVTWASRSPTPVPLVVVAGSADPAVRRRLIAAGAEDFVGEEWLTKDVLGRAIEGAIERARRLAGSGVSVSELRAAELEVQNGQIREANRLKSEFLANMSHELRTPLNAIIGFADLLNRGLVGPLSADQRECTADILTSGRHLLQLINDVLDLAKVESGKMDFVPETIDLAAVAAEVTDTLRARAAQKQIRLQTELERMPGDVSLDPRRVKQVLYNLLSNALEFTPDAGRVTLRIRPEGGDCVRLEVEDTGVGIGPGDLKRLFVEFQQLDGTTAKRHQGTGLGLALTRRMAEAQGGAVGVRSTPGVGSVFWAVLPRESKKLANAR